MTSYLSVKKMKIPYILQLLLNLETQNLIL